MHYKRRACKLHSSVLRQLAIAFELPAHRGEQAHSVEQLGQRGEVVHALGRPPFVWP